MGICVSLALPSNTVCDNGGALSAHVISLNGDLLQIPVPVTVSEVIQQQQSEPKWDPCFLCNSDRLNFNEFISPLKPEFQLEAGQIYFMLPQNKLNYKLTASDMASLAVKASLALQKAGPSSSSSPSVSHSRWSPRRKNRKTRISPIILDLQNQQRDYSENDYILQKRIGGSSSINNNNHKSSVLGVSRSGSVRKLQRASSRRAKLAVRSFRLKLSTIYE